MLCIELEPFMSGSKLINCSATVALQLDCITHLDCTLPITLRVICNAWRSIDANFTRLSLYQFSPPLQQRLLFDGCHTEFLCFSCEYGKFGKLLGF